ncbi:OmpA family protein [Pseudomonas sp. TH31]|uniref:OmpA family protein n=1 Tax=Pseudomonas sp. TH31 TaxID=2796396 RepID=UPI0019142955|nr:OmpA family protein [Pseudomonas sp. TH31]MBK5415450.1 OmpA family protein [Pseudomonas sp. TH31]
MFKRTTLFQAALLGVALCSVPKALAVPAFGNQYTPVAPVSAGQAQVVYYRAATMGAQNGAAHVYVDREFHTGLLPGGFTAFCVAPGGHTLGAYLNDAPQYTGKNTDVYTALLEGGKTYFLKASEGVSSAPQAIKREDAEREMAGSRQQIQAMSRASGVQACNYQAAPPAAAPFKDYALSGDVLFKFGKSGYSDISVQGRQAIRDLISQLKTEHTALEHVEVIGHTDPFGSVSSNQALGLKRAQTVRRLLIDGGLQASTIEASSVGSSEPVSGSCSGSRAEQIACYAQDRRVVVRIDVRR